MSRNADRDGFAGNHFDISVQNCSDHLQLAPHVHVETAEIGHDFEGGVQAEDHRNRHFAFAPRAILVHHYMGVRGREAHDARPRAGGVGACMRRIVKSSFRVHHDVHRCDVRSRFALGVNGDGKLVPVDILAGDDGFLDRPAINMGKSARRLAQPKRQCFKIVFDRDIQGARLKMAMLHVNVGQTKAGFFDDVLKNDGLFALRAQSADMLHFHRFCDCRDDIFVQRQEATQIRVAPIGDRMGHCMQPLIWCRAESRPNRGRDCDSGCRASLLVNFDQFPAGRGDFHHVGRLDGVAVFAD